jgi:hypothetical protein
MNGMTVEIVASSWIDALGGLSMWAMRSVPPDFCAQAAGAAVRARIAATSGSVGFFILGFLLLFVVTLALRCG